MASKGHVPPVHRWRDAIMAPNNGLDAYSCSLALALAKHADNETMRCWPSEELLATEGKMCVRTVQNRLKVLEGAGLIERTARRRSGRAWYVTEYHLCMPGQHPACVAPRKVQHPATGELTPCTPSIDGTHSVPTNSFSELFQELKDAVKGKPKGRSPEEDAKQTAAFFAESVNDPSIEPAFLKAVEKIGLARTKKLVSSLYAANPPAPTADALKVALAEA